MNISKSQLEGIIKTYMRNPIKAKGKERKKISGKYTDEITISDDVQEFSKALKLATQTDNIRTQKVEKLRDKINAGTYSVDGKLVAEKIIDEYFTDKRI